MTLIPSGSEITHPLVGWDYTVPAGTSAAHLAAKEPASGAPRARGSRGE